MPSPWSTCSSAASRRRPGLWSPSPNREKTMPRRSREDDAPNQSRRDFLGASAGALAALGTPSTSTAAAGAMKPFAFEEATLADLGARMASGELTAAALASAYLDRIREIDQAGPALRAVIEVNPDALAIAQSLDRERKSGRVRGPLHGIAVLVKDNIATGDRMSTSAGSLALDGMRAARDAHIVKRLRDAGAVILGKTNLSEWANIRSTRSTSGWSAVGGLVKNPYVLDRGACGSSSGAG